MRAGSRWHEGGGQAIGAGGMRTVGRQSRKVAGGPWFGQQEGEARDQGDQQGGCGGVSAPGFSRWVQDIG